MDPTPENVIRLMGAVGIAMVVAWLLSAALHALTGATLRWWHRERRP